MSGGQFIFTGGQASPGIWGLTGGTGIVSSAPAGRSDTYGFTGSFYRTPNLGGNFGGLIAGMAWFNNPTGLTSIPVPLIEFVDASASGQCILYSNPSGQLYFAHATGGLGTTIGGPSTFALTANAWAYIEFKSLFSTTGTGTCEVRVNGGVVLTATGLTNATTTALAATCQFGNNSGSGTNPYLKDFYVLDTGTGTNTSYLGDINVIELYPNGAGVHSAWVANVGPFTLTSVNGTGVYQGTITGGASNAYLGYNFNVTGFTNGANNVTGGICTASTATALTLTATTVIETHAGSAAFQNPVQIGINKTGTRPNGDVVYLADSTTNDISDFAHTALVLTGSVLGVAHYSYLRKDDAGSRSVAQVCLSGSATEIGSTISLGNTYTYYPDIIELDPSTSAPFTVSEWPV